MDPARSGGEWSADPPGDGGDGIPRSCEDVVGSVKEGGGLARRLGTCKLDARVICREETLEARSLLA